MSTEVQIYSQIANDTAAQLTSSVQEWTAFLTTAARMYKYLYHEQLMIYAQRPNATACADYDLWKNRMGRYVRYGSSGIALIDMTGDSPQLKFVFDVADTGSTERSRHINLWQYRTEHTAVISDMLEQEYGILYENSLEEQFERVAAQLASEYWTIHRRDIFDIVDDSFLFGYDDFNVGVAFRNAATVSITYSLMSRCGMNPDEYFNHEDFLSIFDWNTPEAVAELGTAVSTINQIVLQQIEITIKQYEREHADASRSEYPRAAMALNESERTVKHGQQTNLHTQRGLSDSKPETERTESGKHWQVRENAEKISSGEPTGTVQPTAFIGETASTPAGNRPDSTPAPGADASNAGTGGWSDGGTEGQQPIKMGGTNEQLQGTGGEDNPGGDSVQLTLQESEPKVMDDWSAEGAPEVQLNLFGESMEGEQISMFPSEAQQIQSITEAESARNAPFAFSVSDEDLSHILRLGGNTNAHRMRIVTEFSKQKSADELTTFLQKTYHGGNGFRLDSGDVSVWYAEDGVYLAKGHAARYVTSAQVIPWTEVTERIGAMIDAGRFATNTELTEAPDYERQQIAQTLLYLYHDLSDDAHASGVLSILDSMKGGGYPDEIKKVSAFLESSDNRAELLESYDKFLDAYIQNRDVLRFNYHRPEELRTRMRELDVPRAVFDAALTEMPKIGQFITEDEINQLLAGGSNMKRGKGHIYTFFQSKHTTKEQAEFLKEEYGIGGRSHALSGADNSFMDYSNKGVRLQKRDCADVELSWENAAKRIARLIREDKYLTQNEKVQLQQNTHRNSLYAEYAEFKQEHADDIVLFQVGDFFEIYGEDAKNAAELLGLHLTTQNIPNVGRIEMCGVPVHNWEQYAEELRNKYDVTLSIVMPQTEERGVYTMRSFDHEAELEIDAYEAEFGADGTRVLRDTATPSPTIRELYEKYKPIIAAAVMEDMPYRNACGNSDHENAVTEGNAAIRRVVINSDDLELIRLYSDIPEFRKRLHQEVIDETYTQLYELLRPLSQDDIDDALRTWNGDIDSKRTVVSYMKDHARDKDTAAWLSHEYGGDDSVNLFIIRQGSPESTNLSWAQVQRRIAQLIREDRFFTEQEKAARTRDYSSEYQLLDRLRIDCDYFLGAGGRDEKHLWAGRVYDQIKKMHELYDTLPEKPEWLTKEAIDDYASRMAPRYEVMVYHHFENGFDERMDYQTLQEAEKVAQGYVDGMMEADGFRYDGAAVYDLQEKQWLRVIGDFPLDETTEQVVLQSLDADIDTTAYDEKQPPLGCQ